MRKCDHYNAIHLAKLKNLRDHRRRKIANRERVSAGKPDYIRHTLLKGPSDIGKLPGLVDLPKAVEPSALKRMGDGLRKMFGRDKVKLPKYTEPLEL